MVCRRTLASQIDMCKGDTRRAAAGPTPCAPHVEPWGSSSMSGRVSSQLTTPSAAGRARLAAPCGWGTAEALHLAETAACTPSTRLLSPRAPPPGARASSGPVSWGVVEGVGGDGGRRRRRRRLRRCVPRPHRVPPPQVTRGARGAIHYHTVRWHVVPVVTHGNCIRWRGLSEPEVWRCTVCKQWR